MRHLGWKGITVALLFVLTLGVGCNRTSPPLAPLSAEELPAALEKAFSKAKPDAKDLANQVVASVQAQDYSKAFLAIQSLASRPGLTKDQLSVTSRATLTLNSLLQAAQTKGDPQAAQTLKTYRRDK
jgi:hypothetical protein